MILILPARCLCNSTGQTISEKRNAASLIPRNQRAVAGVDRLRELRQLVAVAPAEAHGPDCVDVHLAHRLIFLIRVIARVCRRALAHVRHVQLWLGRVGHHLRREEHVKNARRPVFAQHHHACGIQHTQGLADGHGGVVGADLQHSRTRERHASDDSRVGIPVEHVEAHTGHGLGGRERNLERLHPVRGQRVLDRLRGVLRPSELGDAVGVAAPE
eukprot:CAMPEP_0180264608 /NCGR_PEP_ID=MMETSP0987-20121128/45897_1 /TAXON_ID=697907 /ORGANISM="non described non described, Strain CCMP2293" /LENGTH=214 /DNA_ID=CAMNT_0022234899 /DNA_START=118 /DNA_END=763 /DNA_ORIENTATION=+